MSRANFIATTVVGLLIAFLAVESYRTAPAETAGYSGGPPIHWSARY